MHWFFECYFNNEAERSAAAAVPLRAARVNGLQPALVMAASHDPLLDEGLAYADKLRAAGVPVEYVKYQGYVHGFWTATGRFDIAAQSHARLCGWHSARPDHA